MQETTILFSLAGRDIQQIRFDESEIDFGQRLERIMLNNMQPAVAVLIYLSLSK